MKKVQRLLTVFLAFCVWGMSSGSLQAQPLSPEMTVYSLSDGDKAVPGLSGSLPELAMNYDAAAVDQALYRLEEAAQIDNALAAIAVGAPALIQLASLVGQSNTGMGFPAMSRGDFSIQQLNTAGLVPDMTWVYVVIVVGIIASVVILIMTLSSMQPKQTLLPAIRTARSALGLRSTLSVQPGTNAVKYKVLNF